MSHRVFIAYALIAGLLLTGCMGTGKVINLDIKPLPTSSRDKKAPPDESLLIVVDPFKDVREDTTKIGLRTHFWGGITKFNAWNGEIGDGMANLTLAYLKQDGWNAHRGGASGTAANPNPDVNLTGQILTWKTRAKSGFGFTQIDVELKVLFEVANAKDGSTVRMVLGTNGTDTVVFFDPQDVQKLTSQAAKQLFQQFFRDLTVKDGTFRLKT